MKRPKDSSKTVLRIELTEKERHEFTCISKKRSTSFREVIHAKIILMADKLLPDFDVFIDCDYHVSIILLKERRGQFFAAPISEPASTEDPYFDYLPTQYLCERIKKEGYDGIMFKSSLLDERDALNLTLFNSNKVKCMTTEFFNGDG